MRQQGGPDAAAWLGRVTTCVSLMLAVLWTNVATAVRMPVRYLTTITRVWENHNSPRFLLRTAALIPKSVHMAGLMRRDGIEHMHAHSARIRRPRRGSSTG